MTHSVYEVIRGQRRYSPSVSMTQTNGAHAGIRTLDLADRYTTASRLYYSYIIPYECKIIKVKLELRNQVGTVVVRKCRCQPPTAIISHRLQQNLLITVSFVRLTSLLLLAAH